MCKAQGFGDKCKIDLFLPFTVRLEPMYINKIFLLRDQGREGDEITEDLAFPMRTERLPGENDP